MTNILCERHWSVECLFLVGDQTSSGCVDRNAMCLWCNAISLPVGWRCSVRSCWMRVLRITTGRGVAGRGGVLYANRYPSDAHQHEGVFSFHSRRVRKVTAVPECKLSITNCAQAALPRAISILKVTRCRPDRIRCRISPAPESGSCPSESRPRPEPQTRWSVTACLTIC